MRRWIATAGLAACLSAGPASAAAVFDWSFENEDGAVAGTVSGQVTLPDGDGTFAALDFVILEVPAPIADA